MDDIDPKLLAESMIGDTGVAKFCIRGKQCSRALTCEFAHADKRGVSVDMRDLFVGRATDLNDCENWTPRKELGSAGDIPRRKPGSGSRHNPHAPNRTRAREALGYKNIVDLTKNGGGKFAQAFSPNAAVHKGALPTPPDLQVKRHIRDGHNIKDTPDA